MAVLCPVIAPSRALSSVLHISSRACVVFGRPCSNMANKRLQPAWSPPSRADGQSEPKLTLFNSLTRQKEEFVSQKDKRVTWYNCGPTVYDASHMGHARTYLTFDIVRRVIQNYFGYNIFYVMNITDIDDKIIKRARQNHLYDGYLASKPALDKVLTDCNAVLKTFATVVADTADPDKRKMQERQFKTLADAVAQVKAAFEKGAEGEIKSAEENLLAKAKDLLSDWLDKEQGSQVTDNAIFAKLPQFWEEEYHKDMEALNILPPDCLTRVSEYVPEIVSYIEEIIRRGYAYESGGSVYFSVAKFDANPDHHYAKLVPEAFGDQGALQEGEGDLSSGADKKSANDFALWKNSKPGEPSWDSPWGKGRPGWHIECSVIASAILGESIDIHTGGVDLKFPHHDNELAQAEAYFDNDHWIRYFLHSGHLTIAGCKMSKSLKNFITIQEVLKTYSARQLRLMFLLHSWPATLDYSPLTMELATSYEKTVNELLLVIKHLLRSTPGHGIEAFKKWDQDTINLNNQLQECKYKVHEAFCDNIDTRTALMAIKELVGQTNGYISKMSSDPSAPNRGVLKNVALYITEIFEVLGLIPSGEQIGFPSSSASGQVTNTEEVVMPYLEALSTFRDDVRRDARGIKAVSILQACDRIRDEVLPNLGVRLEDKPEPQPTVIKLVDKDELIRERENKLKQEEAKRLEKEKKKAQAEAKQAARDAKSLIPPWDMFKGDDKWSKFDDKGIPTHDKQGEEISKAQLKKLQKLYDQREQKYNKSIASKEGDKKEP